MALFAAVTASLLSVILVHSADYSIYVGVDTNKNWDDAKLDCENIVKGQLATWSSTSDYDAIKTVRNELSNNAWVGLTDVTSERSWEFVDGDTDYWYGVCLFV